MKDASESVIKSRFERGQHAQTRSKRYIFNLLILVFLLTAGSQRHVTTAERESEMLQLINQYVALGKCCQACS